MAKTKSKTTVEVRTYTDARDTERAGHWTSLIERITKAIATQDSLNATFCQSQNEHMSQKVEGMREALFVIENNLAFLIIEFPAAAWRDFVDVLDDRISDTTGSYREGLYQIRDMAREY